VADVFADPQIIARGMKIDLPSQAAKGGAIPSVRSPIVMDGQPMAAGRPSPRLGEHTDEVLSDPSWMA
jgi:crotonobetainyl-CoA:carnitine CoA-transferase CaiB-like acyl-CoA transferase